MKQLWFSLFATLMFTIQAVANCVCQDIQCGSCEIQKGFSFYSEKCDNEKVKSCKKPNCVKDPECSVPTANTEPETPKAVKKEAHFERKAAKITEIQGSIYVYRADQTLSPKEEDTIYERDEVVSEDGTATLQFFNGNEVKISKSSKIKIAQYSGGEGPSRTRIHLNFGKIKSKINEKYDGVESYFRVKSPAAVAGVRGTDFVMLFDPKSNFTTVQTIEGTVELSPRGDKSSKVQVPQGTYASYRARGNVQYVISDDEVDQFLASGDLSEPAKMDEKTVGRLEQEWKINLAKKKTDDEPMICKSPQGRFNDCAWTRAAEGKGACIRKRCNANGQWSDETRLPASYKDSCPPDKTKVTTCNY